MSGIAVDSPDRVLPYAGIGSVCFHIMEYEWAVRCFLKVRSIREKTQGGDTVDCATIYNNLGCCMLKLNRFREANAYLKLAKAIF